MRHLRRLTLWILCSCGLTASLQAGCPRLFPDELMHAEDSLIFRFIERYACRLDSLDRAGAFVPDRIRDDGVVFTVGTFETFAQVRPEDTFSLQRVGDRLCEVCWTDTLGMPRLRFSFPLSFELLLGKPQVEIEKEMKAMLLRQPLHAEVVALPDSCTLTPDGCWQTAPAAHYYLPELNTSCYYRRTDTPQRWKPVYDREHAVASAINLLQGVLPQMDDHMLYIEQSLYGFETHAYRVQLSQWVNYCRATNLTVYVGLQEERTDGVRLLLMAQSHDLGFDHMMSVVVPEDLTTDPHAVLKARLHAFIPTHNVKSLYQEQENETYNQ